MNKNKMPTHFSKQLKICLISPTPSFKDEDRKPCQLPRSLDGSVCRGTSKKQTEGKYRKRVTNLSQSFVVLGICSVYSRLSSCFQLIIFNIWKHSKKIFVFAKTPPFSPLNKVTSFRYAGPTLHMPRTHKFFSSAAPSSKRCLTCIYMTLGQVSYLQIQG